MTAADFERYSAPRGWTRAAVEGTWEANSGVKFVGWQQCTTSPDYYGIRISLADDAAQAPYTLGLGSRLNNVPQGMVLNFTFNNWSPSCRGREEYCVSRIAVHEFGHALGFAHEQNRSDTPATCDDPNQGSNGDTMIGAWDLASVMNYCNPQWNGDGKLSATDIQMAQLFYGPRQATESIFVVTRAEMPAKVTEYDASTRQVRSTAEFDVGTTYHYARKMLASPNGKRLYLELEIESPSGLQVRDAQSSVLVAYDPAARAVLWSKRVSRTASTTLKVAPDNSVLYYAADNKISAFDADSGTLKATITLPDNNTVQALSTASSDTDSVFALVNYGSIKQVIVRASRSAQAVQASFDAGPLPLLSYETFSVSGDGQRAYYLKAIRSMSTGHLSEMNLTSGVIKEMSKTDETGLVIAEAVDNQTVLYARRDKSYVTPIIFYDVANDYKQTIAASTALNDTVQYDPVSRSIYVMNGLTRSLSSLVRQVDGTYKSIDLGLRAFSDSTRGDAPFNGPFVFVRS